MGWLMVLSCSDRLRSDSLRSEIWLSQRSPAADKPAGDSTPSSAETRYHGVRQELRLPANRHRALAYVRRALTRLGLWIDPQAERALGSKLLVRLGHAAVVQQRFLRQLYERLQTANVPLLVLTGPVLAPLLYPSAVSRPSADLNIEVRIADVDATIAALEASGLRECDFDPEIVRHEHAEHVHGSSAFHRVFSSNDGQIRVDLNVDALQLGVRFSRRSAMAAG